MKIKLESFCEKPCPENDSKYDGDYQILLLTSWKYNDGIGKIAEYKKHFKHNVCKSRRAVKTIISLAVILAIYQDEDIKYRGKKEINHILGDID